MATYITEISTPFVNYRSMWLSLGQGNHPLFQVNMYLFGILYLFFRVLFYPFTIWKLIHGYTLYDKKFPTNKLYFSYFLSTLYISIYFLQLFWFYKIIQSIQKGKKRATTTTTQGKDNKKE